MLGLTAYLLAGEIANKAKTNKQRSQINICSLVIPFFVYYVNWNLQILKMSLEIRGDHEKFLVGNINEVFLATQLATRREVLKYLLRGITITILLCLVILSVVLSSLAQRRLVVMGIIVVLKRTCMLLYVWSRLGRRLVFDHFWCLYQEASLDSWQ